MSADGALPPAAALHLPDGRPLRLGRRLGGGGEGQVYAVALRPALAVKLYAPGAAAAREAKVRAMIRAGLADRTPLAAFPQAAVMDAEGRFAGFVMGRIAHAQPLHELYAPGARKRAFPAADYRFVARVATNAARAVAGAHRAGCVIGDVNHSGFLIGRDALVALIDADSFQIDDGATRHLCRVGVPEYTPPELQGAKLAETPRTPDHDAFGLAVVLFQLLFLGRHPFAGVGAELAPEEAIAAHAFAYGRRPGPLRPPPGALRLSEIPPEIAGLFEAAFAADAAGRRPTAEAWVAALERFEAGLTQCAADPRHWRPGEPCPWCRLEKGRRTRLFPAPGAPGSAPRPVDLRALRARLDAIRLPESFAYRPPEPLPSSAPPPPTARALWLGRLGVAALAGMMACAGMLVWVSPQNFLMATPICVYGFGPVSDALLPRRAARRALARLDRDLADALVEAQRRVGLDAAWLLRAELAQALAQGRRADVVSLTRDVGRLETMAAAIADAETARDPAVETLLARRAVLAAACAARGDVPGPAPVAPPRALREATRRRLGLG